MVIRTVLKQACKEVWERISPRRLNNNLRALFAVYFTRTPVSPTTASMIRKLVDYNFERIYGRDVVTYSKYYPVICLEVIYKTIKKT